MDSMLPSSDSASVSLHPLPKNPTKRFRASAHQNHMDIESLKAADYSSQSQGERLIMDVAFYLKNILLHQPSQPPANRHLNAHPWPKLCLKWMLVTYCCISITFFSLDMYTQTPTAGVGDARNEYGSLSAFDDTSTAQRLVRMVSLQSNNFLGFDPYIIRAQEQNGDMVTACLWTSELEDIEVLRTWVSQWQGPVSLLLTTTAKPGSRSFISLLHRLHSLQTGQLHGLSVHLLRVAFCDQVSSNSYLNLARLFASTPVVILVPADISEEPPMSHKMVVTRLFQPDISLPSIVTGGSTNRSEFFTLPQLSPILLGRNHLVWCTERLLFHKSRTSEWTACLWQLWLDSFGDFSDLGKINKTMNPIGIEVTSDRLSSRLRAEACDLATRTSAAGFKRQKDKKKRLQWLKETCGQNINVADGIVKIER